jgi:hypothetical protein
MERRAFLAAAAATPAGLVSAQAAQYDGLPDDVGAALARFRNSIPSNFDRDYVEHAVVPFFLTSIYEGERPALPMIDVTLSKENALPFDLWGLIYKGWQPAPEEGVLRRQASCSVPVKCEPQRSLSTCWTCST